MDSEQVSRSCPVCGVNDARPFLSKGELRLVRCRHCLMVYANPVPSAFASGEAYGTIGSDYYLSAAKLESDYSDVRFERELRLFRSHVARGAVLDVGCSSGAFLYQLGKRWPGEYATLGMDVSGPALDYAESRGIAVRRGNFPGHDFGEARFDAVTFWAVLEHVPNPESFLRQAASVLKPGGLCFVLVPNLQSLAARLLGPRYRYIYPQHLNYFSADSLERLAAAHLRLVELRSMHFNPLVIWNDFRHGGRDVPNAERAQLLQRTTAWKERPLLNPLKLLYRLVELGLGRLRLADNLAAVLSKRQDSALQAGRSGEAGDRPVFWDPAALQNWGAPRLRGSKCRLTSFSGFAKLLHADATITQTGHGTIPDPGADVQGAGASGTAADAGRVVAGGAMRVRAGRAGGVGDADGVAPSFPAQECRDRKRREAGGASVLPVGDAMCDEFLPMCGLGKRKVAAIGGKAPASFLAAGFADLAK
jgi:2-polyprenyl-3-methyl-5-hydroxy-6-metoxy-1,4-benzoquinol methylase